MKIAFGTTMWSRDSLSGKLDGLGVYTKEIYKAFKSMDLELSLYSFTDRKEDDIKVCRPLLPFSIHALTHYLFKLPIDDMKSCINSCDILFTPDHHIAYSQNTPTVATVMDIIPLINEDWVSPSKLRKLKNYLFSSAIKSCDRVITVSKHTKRDLIKYLNLSEDIIDIVPLGVDKRFFNKLASNELSKILKKYGLKEKKFFLNVGTIQPRKNISTIIESHKRLPNSIKREYPLIIVGKYGWRAQKDIEEIKELENRGYGRWINYIPDRDLIALLQSAKAILYPSLYEGFGLPILEAFASETAVIASDSSSIPEVAGDCAILLNPYDIDGFSKAMIEVIEKDTSDMIYKAKQRASSFTWQNSANAHIEVFKKML